MQLNGTAPGKSVKPLVLKDSPDGIAAPYKLKINDKWAGAILLEDSKGEGARTSYEFVKEDRSGGQFSVSASDKSSSIRPVFTITTIAPDWQTVVLKVNMTLRAWQGGVDGSDGWMTQEFGVFQDTVNRYSFAGDGRRPIRGINRASIGDRITDYQVRGVYEGHDCNKNFPTTIDVTIPMPPGRHTFGIWLYTYASSKDDSSFTVYNYNYHAEYYKSISLDESPFCVSSDAEYRLLY